MQIEWRREPSFAGRDIGAPAALAGLALACLVAAFVLSPQAVASGPTICPFRLITGLPCPGCGLTRSWVALAHGDAAAAFSSNLFGPLAFAASFVFVGLTLTSPLTGVSPGALSRKRPLRVAARVVVGAWVVWAVLRAASVALT